VATSSSCFRTCSLCQEIVAFSVTRRSADRHANSFARVYHARFIGRAQLLPKSTSLFVASMNGCSRARVLHDGLVHIWRRPWPWRSAPESSSTPNVSSTLTLCRRWGRTTLGHHGEREVGGCSSSCDRGGLQEVIFMVVWSTWLAAISENQRKRTCKLWFYWMGLFWGTGSYDRLVLQCHCRDINR
jgi:hypothetical protein